MIFPRACVATLLGAVLLACAPCAESEHGGRGPVGGKAYARSASTPTVGWRVLDGTPSVDGRRQDSGGTADTHSARAPSPPAPRPPYATHTSRPGLVGAGGKELQGHPAPMAKTEGAEAAVHTAWGRAAAGDRTASRSVGRHRYAAPHWATPAPMLGTNGKRQREKYRESSELAPAATTMGKLHATRASRHLGSR